MVRATIFVVGGCVGILIGLGIMLIGGSLYLEQHRKELAFTEDACLVVSGSYEGNKLCGSVKKRFRETKKCYQPVWQVVLSSNKTERYTIKGDIYPGYEHVLESIKKYQVDQTYPCWYDKQHPLNLSFYRPKSTPGLILLICGAVVTLLAIICLVISNFMRSKPDL